MLPEDVLACEPRVLTQAQREFYFENGYLLVPSVISGEWLERLRQVTDEMVARTRSMAESDGVFDLEAGHSADSPRLRRLSNPVEHHETYWEFASQSILPDVMADLVGPDVKFHHSKLNFKWAGGGSEVKWHQDISYWPHTNYSPLTAGLYLYDCGPEQAPLLVVPGSHQGELFDQYDDEGDWTGHLSPVDLKAVATETAAELAGPAGSVTIHNCRVVHGSLPNLSPVGPAPAAQRVLGGRRLHLHGQPAAEPLRGHDRAGPAGPLGPPRSPTLPDPARLVRRVHVDLRHPAGRGIEGCSKFLGDRARAKELVSREDAPVLLPPPGDRRGGRRAAGRVRRRRQGAGRRAEPRAAPGHAPGPSRAPGRHRPRRRARAR